MISIDFDTASTSLHSPVAFEGIGLLTSVLARLIFIVGRILCPFQQRRVPHIVGLWLQYRLSNPCNREMIHRSENRLSTDKRFEELNSATVIFPFPRHCRAARRKVLDAIQVAVLFLFPQFRARPPPSLLFSSEITFYVAIRL